MFKLKDHILVPKDILILARSFWRWSHYTDWLGILALGLYIFVFGYLFTLPAEPLFFIGFILAIIYYEMDSRVSIALALVCLVTIPILLSLFNKNILYQGEIWAEQVAVWAYYFLVIGVVRQIFEYRADAKAEAKKKKALGAVGVEKKKKGKNSQVINLKKGVT